MCPQQKRRNVPATYSGGCYNYVIKNIENVFFGMWEMKFKEILAKILIEKLMCKTTRSIGSKLFCGISIIKMFFFSNYVRHRCKQKGKNEKQ